MSVNYKACKDKKFVNPYSFIELINNELSDNARIEHGNEQKLYGYIECKIKTKTPLAILGNCSKGTDGHKVYDFFRVNCKPTIPGSSVRAMIRMAYETLTDSCLVTLKDNYAITERVSPKDAFIPGVLVRDGDNNWELYKAERIRFKLAESGKKGVEINGYKFQSGDYIGIKEEKKIIYEGDLCNGEKKKYVLVIGEGIEKKYESIFKIGERLDYRSEDIERAIIELDYIVEMYQNKSINKKYEEDKGWYKTYWKEKEKGVIPVWYKVINNKLYVSKAAIGRKVFKKTVNELIYEQYRPCPFNERESLCPACSLFGTARGKGKGSKIRVTDAAFTNEEFKSKVVTLRELGSPHVGYYLFYGKNGKTYDDNKAAIAGRKYYWHIPKAIDDASIYSTDVKNERNCSCELAPEGSEFSFKVYFDGIAKKQLNQLMWAINMGENDPEGNMCHRLGHGKPLGLGSIKVVIDKVTYREYTKGQYNLKEGTQETEDLGFNNYALNDLKLVSDFTFMKDMEVKYPEVIASKTNDSESININDVAAHKWFLNNKKKLEPIKNGKKAKEYQFSAIELKEKLKEDNSNKKGSKGNWIKIEVGMQYELKVDLNTSNERFIKLKNSDGLMASVPRWVLEKNLNKIEDDDLVVLKCIGEKNGYPKWEVVKY